MHKLIDYRNNYLKIFGSLWQYITNFSSNSDSFKSKVKITQKTPADGYKKEVKIAVSLKFLSSSWMKVPLINYEINLILTWYQNCVISFATWETKISITNRKLLCSSRKLLCSSLLSTHGKSKLLESSKSDFRRKISLNKYQSKRSREGQNLYTDYLIDSSFQGLNRPFVLKKRSEKDTQDLFFQL